MSVDDVDTPVESPIEGGLLTDYTPVSGFTIKILGEDFAIDAPAHRIEKDIIIEGIALPCEITQAVKRKTTNWNEEAGYHEIKRQTVPFVLTANMEDKDDWFNSKILIRPALEPVQCNGIKLFFSSFEPFEGMMDRRTIEKILHRDHLEKYEHTNVFEELRQEVQRILEVDDAASAVISLWTAGTFVFDAFSAYPYLWFTGIKGSGKTTALELIVQVAYHAEMGMRISNPALFRDVHLHKATVCYDEAENLLAYGTDKAGDQDRISLFNSGYRASGKVRLVEKIGDNFKTRCFCSYSPKALASIHPIDEALQSRCLVVLMMRALDPQKATEEFDIDKLGRIRQHLFMFRFANGLGFYDLAHDKQKNEDLRKKYDLKNRDWELFKPILILAEHFCSKWLEDIKAFIESQRVIREIDNQFSPEMNVVAELDALMNEANHASGDAKTIISFRDFLERLKSDYPEMKNSSTRSIGNTFRRMGLTALVGRNARGMFIRVDKSLLDRQMKRAGLVIDSAGEKQGVLF